MKKVLTIAPLLLALAAVAMPAAARDRHRDRHHDRYSHSRDHDRRWDRDQRRAYDRGYRDGRRDDRWRGAHRGNGRHGPPPWARGRDYRSYGYRNVYFVPVADYARYRLHRPHHGYRWVRDDRGNFLLVAVATGIIASVLLGHAY